MVCDRKKKKRRSAALSEAVNAQIDPVLLDVERDWASANCQALFDLVHKSQSCIFGCRTDTNRGPTEAFSCLGVYMGCGNLILSPFFLSVVCTQPQIFLQQKHHVVLEVENITGVGCGHCCVVWSVVS